MPTRSEVDDVATALAITALSTCILGGMQGQATAMEPDMQAELPDEPVIRDALAVLSELHAAGPRPSDELLDRGSTSLRALETFGEQFEDEDDL